MDKYTYSIIIPVYNTEKYIERCIKSVIEQKENNYEIIIINDGSTDSSEDIVMKIIKTYRDISIKYVKQENMGLSEARNVGLGMAVGKYVIWLDSDDALREGALTQLNTLVQKNPDVILNRIASYDEKKNIVMECKYRFDMDVLMGRTQLIKMLRNLKGFWFAAWCFVIKRELLIKTGLQFKKGIYHEDELWAPQLICLGESFCCNQEYYYLNTALRENSIITKKNIKKEFDKLVICRELKNFQCNFIDKKVLQYLRKRIFILLYTVYISIEDYCENENVKKLKKEFYDILKEFYGWKRGGVLFIFKLKSVW